MYYNSLIKTDLVNGPGIRVSLFVSGCTLNCKECFNREAQNFKYGLPYNEEVEDYILELLGDKHISGLSILGGEPCHPKNIDKVTKLVRIIKNRYTDKTVYVWTGYELEELRERGDCKSLLKLIDVLIDGPFIKELHDPELVWRGSTNQRILYRNIDF